MFYYMLDNRKAFRGYLVAFSHNIDKATVLEDGRDL
jgi:hypothetical protein